jgi:hypothetical protein
MEVCFNDDQRLFAKKTNNHEKKVGCFLSFLFKWLQDRVVHFQ